MTDPAVLSRAPLSRAGSATVARSVLVSGILASSMAFIDGTAMSVALPALQADLGATGAHLLWVTNGFSLPLAALLLFGGALGDAWGRRRMFMAGIVAFALASLACGLAPDVRLLIAARVAQGVGGALMIPGSLAMISSYHSPEERGKAIGRWSAFSVLATTLGPVLGGVLAGLGLWRGVFFIDLPIAIAALIVLWRRVPAELPPDRRVGVDWSGAGAVTIGLAALNHGLIEASKHGLSDLRVLMALGLGMVALIVFVILQARGRAPLLPLAVFKSRTLVAAGLVSLCFYAAFHGALFFVPLNLIQVQGYAPALAGATQLPLMALLVLLSPKVGRWVDRRGPRPALVAGPAVAAIGFLWFAVPGVTGGPREFATAFLPGFLLVGAGLGLTAVPLSTAVMSAVSSERLGLASGINSSVTRLAGVAAVALLGPIVLASFTHALAGRAHALNLPPPAQAQLLHEAANLGNTQVPDGLDAATTAAVQQAVNAAFVDAFRLAVMLAAALSAGAALIAWRGLSRTGVIAERQASAPAPSTRPPAGATARTHA